MAAESATLDGGACDDASTQSVHVINERGFSVAASEAATREVGPASSAEQSPSAQAQQHRQSASAPLTCGNVAGAKRPRFSAEKHSEPPMRTLLWDRELLLLP